MENGRRHLSLKVNATAKGMMLLIFFAMVVAFGVEQWEDVGRAGPVFELAESPAEPVEVEEEVLEPAEPTAATAEPAPPAEPLPTPSEEQPPVVPEIDELVARFSELKAMIEPEQIQAELSRSSEQMEALAERLAVLEEQVTQLSLLHSVSVKVFDAKTSTPSPGFPNPTAPWTFGSAAVEVEFAEGERAVVSSSPDGTGQLAYDNELFMNGQSLGTGFTGLEGPGGGPAEETWAGVPPVDVTPHVPTGQTEVTFELRDDGGWHGNTAIYLTVFRRG